MDRRGPWPTQARVSPPSATMPRYKRIKAWHEQQWGLATTPCEKLEVLRKTVRQGRYAGDRRVINMFKNSEGESTFNPNIHQT